jgi:biopolymer transport protein ExbB
MQKRYKRSWMLFGLLVLACCLFPLAGWAQDAADGRPTTFMDYFKQGGITMVPLSFCAIWALAVLIEVLVRMRKKVVCPEMVLQQIRQAISVGDYQKAWSTANNSTSPLGRMMSEALARLPKGRDAVEEAAIETAANISSDFKVKLSYLSLNAGVAPMWGLFGTISGMIGAFNAMAFGGAVGDPTKLAGDIGEALITTYAGLVIAIPAMMAYFILLAHLRKVMGVVQDAFIGTLEMIDFSSLPEDLTIVTDAPTPAAGAAPASGGDKVACPNCKKEIKVGVKACPFCKTEMDWE